MKFNFQHEKEKIRAETYLNKLRSTLTIRIVEIKAKRKKGLTTKTNGYGDVFILYFCMLLSMRDGNIQTLSKFTSSLKQGLQRMK